MRNKSLYSLNYYLWCFVFRNPHTAANIRNSTYFMCLPVTADKYKQMLSSHANRKIVPSTSLHNNIIVTRTGRKYFITHNLIQWLRCRPSNKFIWNLKSIIAITTLLWYTARLWYSWVKTTEAWERFCFFKGLENTEIV